MPHEKHRGKSDTLKTVTDIVTAGATVVAALSLVLAYFAYKDQERSALLLRTQAALATAAKEYSDDSIREPLLQFKGRWDDIIRPMTDAEAEDLFNISVKPDNSPAYRKWNAARQHLNTLEGLSFVYVNDLVDRKFLASVTCLEIVRSNRYFAPLIRKFAGPYPAHGWWTITKAAEMLEHEYGPECNRIKSGS